MHITLESDYAIRIVLCMARKKERIDANSIALQTGVPLRFSLKILRNLVGAGIAKSFKGTQGGYELNVKPEEITLKDILETVEGEYRFSRCISSEEGDCSNPNCDSCRVQAVFSKITTTVRKMLQEVTIASLL